MRLAPSCERTLRLLLASHTRRSPFGRWSIPLPRRTTTRLRQRTEFRPGRHLATTRASLYMEAEDEALVGAVHATSTKAVFYVTGGAATALGWLISVPGASSTVLEAVVPYAQTSAEQLLESSGALPSYSDKAHTVRLATAAYQKAAQLTPVGEWDIMGVGVACALATNRPKKGVHKCNISIQSCTKRWMYEIQFEKDHRRRLEEELLSSRLLLMSFAGAVGVIPPEDVESSMKSILLASERERFDAEVIDLDDPVHALLGGSAQCVEFSASHFVLDAPRRNVLLLPGSFNPIHEGHLKMLEAAEQQTGQKGMFELSILNPDKGLLAEETIRQRLVQFKEHNVPVLLTRASMFRDKAVLFHDCTFVVGYDTAIRILDPKYYGGTEANMLLMLETIRHRGCRFLVAGRVAAADGGGKTFLRFEDLQIPADFRDMFQSLEGFRLDISSTEIRAQLAKKGS